MSTIWLRPSVPVTHVASSNSGVPSNITVNSRGYSDSAVPNCRAILMNDSETEENPIPPSNHLDGPGKNSANAVLPSGNIRPRQPLQLPSFRELGISSFTPNALLTPPDEGTIDFKPVPPPILISRSSSYPPSNMPKTPSPDIIKSAVGSSIVASTAEASSPNPSVTTAAESQDACQTQDKSPSGDGLEDGSSNSVPGGWLVKAVEAAAANVDPHDNNVINVLCHSQPCPISQRVPATDPVTALDEMMTGIQNRIDTTNRYIHIHHAIPSKFSMNQIPNSPVITPGVHNTGTAAPDYFSIQTNIFSSAVVATNHADALKSPVPSSPHPVVAPSSITVSLLERFIPPSSAEEYLSLFLANGPSVLLDRLYELSHNDGNMIFIYPTSHGAATFANQYLGPLLHPHLRTMCSIHNLSMDFGAGVGSIGAVDQMLGFEDMQRKLNIMLRKLSRGVSVTRRADPKYTLVASSKQTVDLDRYTWTNWWAHQETARIRSVVERYLKRGLMLPVRVGGKDVSAATLVQEVLDGVREGREYADYDVERTGVEVAVFVIRRTA